MRASREKFEENITVLGLVAFENKMKQNTRELMERMNTSEINCKVITGDHLYVGIEVAIKAGIIVENS